MRIQGPKPKLTGEQEVPSAPTRIPGLEPAADHSVQGLHRTLEERLLASADFRPNVADSVAVESAAAPEEMRPPKSNFRARLIKALIGLAVVAIFGWIPLRALLQASSVEAIVNSRVITVRAPIEGEVTLARTDLSGTGVIEKDQVLLRIVNPRADRARLDDLRDRLAHAEITRSALKTKIASSKQAHDELVQGLARFTHGRILQLEARTAGLAAEVMAAEAQRDVAEAAAERALTLSRSGNMAAAELQRLERARTIAEQSVISAARQLDAANVELDAMRAGTFLGDSYNDRPSSAQRRDELRQRIEDLDTDLAATETEIAQLHRQLAEEATRYQAFAEAAVSLPVTGRVWEVLTAPGEQVRVGQDLLKLLDCSGAVITANVTEAVYNRLSVGAPARFRPADGGAELDGLVINLTGLGDAPANLAINPTALSREGYRVTVHVPELATELECAVGRTGRVIFDKAPADGS
jgi:multidrug resistance efflux pump